MVVVRVERFVEDLLLVCLKVAVQLLTLLGLVLDLLVWGKELLLGPHVFIVSHLLVCWFGVFHIFFLILGVLLRCWVCDSFVGALGIHACLLSGLSVIVCF